MKFMNIVVAALLFAMLTGVSSADLIASSGGGGPTTYTLTVVNSCTSCGTTGLAVGTHTYDAGTRVGMVSTASSGYETTGWTGSGTGSCTSASNCVLTMNGNIKETADFARLPVIVSASVSGTVNFGQSITYRAYAPGAPTYTTYNFIVYNSVTGTMLLDPVTTSNSFTFNVPYTYNGMILVARVGAQGTGGYVSESAASNAITVAPIPTPSNICNILQNVYVGKGFLCSGFNIKIDSTGRNGYILYNPSLFVANVSASYNGAPVNPVSQIELFSNGITVFGSEGKYAEIVTGAITNTTAELLGYAQVGIVAVTTPTSTYACDTQVKLYLESNVSCDGINVQLAQVGNPSLGGVSQAAVLIYDNGLLTNITQLAPGTTTVFQPNDTSLIEVNLNRTFTSTSAQQYATLSLTVLPRPAVTFYSAQSNTTVDMGTPLYFTVTGSNMLLPGLLAVASSGALNGNLCASETGGPNPSPTESALPVQGSNTLTCEFTPTSAGNYTISAYYEYAGGDLYGPYDQAGTGQIIINVVQPVSTITPINACSTPSIVYIGHNITCGSVTLQLADLGQPNSNGTSTALLTIYNDGILTNVTQVQPGTQAVFQPNATTTAVVNVAYTYAGLYAYQKWANMSLDVINTAPINSCNLTNLSTLYLGQNITCNNFTVQLADLGQPNFAGISSAFIKVYYAGTLTNVTQLEPVTTGEFTVDGYLLLVRLNSTFSGLYAYQKYATISIIAQGPTTTTVPPTSSYSGINPIPPSSVGSCEYATPCSLPVGISSYGLSEDSEGQLSVAAFSTNEEVGIANTSSLFATTYVLNEGSAASPNSLTDNGRPYGAGLQLNSVLRINTTNGVQYYWLQNVAIFDNTSSKQVSFSDQVFNDWTINYTSDNVMYSGAACHISGSEPYLCSIGSDYAYALPDQSYSLPTTFELTTALSYNSSAVVIPFYYSTSQSGTVNYDTVKIMTPGIISASILSVPNAHTPVNYAAVGSDFVWGGYGDGEDANFTALNSSMGLYYFNGASLSPVPPTYDFSTNTGEATDDLHVTAAGSSINVAVGTLNPGYILT